MSSVRHYWVRFIGQLGVFWGSFANSSRLPAIAGIGRGGRFGAFTAINPLRGPDLERVGDKAQQVFEVIKKQQKERVGDIDASVTEKGIPLFSVRRLSPVAQTYLDALKAAIPDQFVTTEDTTADPYGNLPEERKKRLKGSRGVPVASLLQSAKIHGQDVWQSMTRNRPFLDPKEQATVADILRTHQDTPDNAIRRAMQVLQGIVGGMKPKQYEIFTLHLLLQDMIRDIDSGLLANRAELPLGFTKDEACDYSDYLSNLVDNDPVIKGAVKRRRNFQEK
jgi:hypothetical protein